MAVGWRWLWTLWILKTISDVVETLHLSYFRSDMTSMCLDFACSKEEEGGERQTEREKREREHGRGETQRTI